MRREKGRPAQAPNPEDVRGGGHPNFTTRFVAAHPWTVADVTSALTSANAAQLVRALDHSTDTTTACHCPVCGALRAVTAIGLHHWRCDRCHTTGAWVALRWSVSLSVEACVRLCEIVHSPHRREVAA